MKRLANFIMRIGIFTLSASIFTGCLPGGSGGSSSLTLTNAPSVDNATGISIGFTSLNSKTVEQYTQLGLVDELSKIYLNTTSVTITGTCVFGVSKVVGFVDGTQVAEEAQCSSDMTFSWVKNFPAGTPETGTTYLIELKPATSAGEVYGNLQANQFISTTVLIDDNSPAAITSVAVADSYMNGTVFNLNGGTGSSAVAAVTATAPADAYRLEIDNYEAISVTLTGTTASFSDTIVEGVAKTFNVVVFDRAGNFSPIEPIEVSYLSSLPAPAYTFNTFSKSTSNTTGSAAYNLYGGMGPFPSRVKSSSEDTTIQPDLLGTLTKSQ